MAAFTALSICPCSLFYRPNHVKRYISCSVGPSRSLGM